MGENETCYLNKERRWDGMMVETADLLIRLYLESILSTIVYTSNDVIMPFIWIPFFVISVTGTSCCIASVRNCSCKLRSVDFFKCNHPLPCKVNLLLSLPDFRRIEK